MPYRFAYLMTCLLGIWCVGPVQANLLPRPFRLALVNLRLAGRVIDHTSNHCKDNRIPAPSLCGRRDLYVYLPPGYCPCKRYPVVFYMHGFLSDEVHFLRDVVQHFDRAIVEGKLPPVIIAAPDTSVQGISCLSTVGTFYLNSKLGNFEDYFVRDVYDFVMTHYPIRPEPEAHLLFGVSMGGGAAFAKAMKFPDKFKIAVGIFPPLNLRYMSTRGRYMDNFDPSSETFRTDFSRSLEIVGRFFIVPVSLGRLVNPLYGRNNPEIATLVARENPIELLDSLNIQPGHLELYAAYGGRDEFNMDAQTESFLNRARQKGIDVGVGYDPRGRHNVRTAVGLLPGILNWLQPRLSPYAPR